jgi:hypothetical protein
MYTDQKVEYNILAAALSVGAQGPFRIAPGITPVRVRKLGIILGNVAITVSNLVISWRLRTGINVTAGQTTPLVQTVTPALGLANRLFYADGLDILVKPGMELCAEVTNAPTGGTNSVIFAEAIPEWEAPLNNPVMFRVVA